MYVEWRNVNAVKVEVPGCRLVNSTYDGSVEASVVPFVVLG